MNLTEKTMTHSPSLYGLAVNKKVWHRLVEALWNILRHTPPKIQKCTPPKKDIIFICFTAKSSFFSFLLVKFFNLSSIHLSFIPYNPKTNQHHPTSFAMQQQRTAGGQRRPSLLFHEVTSSSQVVWWLKSCTKWWVQTVSFRGLSWFIQPRS